MKNENRRRATLKALAGLNHEEITKMRDIAEEHDDTQNMPILDELLRNRGEVVKDNTTVKWGVKL